MCFEHGQDSCLHDLCHHHLLLLLSQAVAGSHGVDRIKSNLISAEVNHPFPYSGGVKLAFAEVRPSPDPISNIPQDHEASGSRAEQVRVPHPAHENPRYACFGFPGIPGLVLGSSPLPLMERRGYRVFIVRVPAARSIRVAAVCANGRPSAPAPIAVVLESLIEVLPSSNTLSGGPTLDKLIEGLRGEGRRRVP